MNKSPGGMDPRSNNPLTSLYVGDLHPDVTDTMLYEKFSQAGLIRSIRVCRDLKTSRSLGYAYIEFREHSDAQRAIESMNFDDMNGRPMRIAWSQYNPDPSILMRNFDEPIDNQDKKEKLGLDETDGGNGEQAPHVHHKSNGDDKMQIQTSKVTKNPPFESRTGEELKLNVRRTFKILSSLTRGNVHLVVDQLCTHFAWWRDENESYTAKKVADILFSWTMLDPGMVDAIAIVVKNVFWRLKDQALQTNFIGRVQIEFEAELGEIEILEYRVEVAVAELKPSLLFQLDTKRQERRLRNMTVLNLIGHLYLFNVLGTGTILECLELLLCKGTDESFEHVHSLVRAVGQKLNTDIVLKLNLLTTIESQGDVQLFRRVCTLIDGVAKGQMYSEGIRAKFLNLIELRHCLWEPSSLLKLNQKRQEFQRAAALRPTVGTPPPRPPPSNNEPAHPLTPNSLPLTFSTKSAPPPVNPQVASSNGPQISPWKPSVLRNRRVESRRDASGDSEANQDFTRTTTRILNKLTPQNVEVLAKEFYDLFQNCGEDQGRNGAILHHLCSQAITAVKQDVLPLIVEVLTFAWKQSLHATRSPWFVELLKARLPVVCSDLFVKICKSKATTSWAGTEKERAERFALMTLIGQFFNAQLFSRKVITECLDVLVVSIWDGSYELLCHLLKLIGSTFESKFDFAAVKGDEVVPVNYMANLFLEIHKVGNGTRWEGRRLSTRVRFAIHNLVELRGNGWIARSPLANLPPPVPPLKVTNKYKALEPKAKRPPFEREEWGSLRGGRPGTIVPSTSTISKAPISKAQVLTTALQNILSLHPISPSLKSGRQRSDQQQLQQPQQQPPFPNKLTTKPPTNRKLFEQPQQAPSSELSPSEFDGWTNGMETMIITPTSTHPQKDIWDEDWLEADGEESPENSPVSETSSTKSRRIAYNREDLLSAKWKGVQSARLEELIQQSGCQKQKQQRVTKDRRNPKSFGI